MAEIDKCPSCGRELNRGLAECPHCGSMTPLRVSLDPKTLVKRVAVILFFVAVGFFIKSLLT